MSRTLLPREQGTRVLFGKPYHWHLAGDQLQLVAGKADDCDRCDFQATAPGGDA